MTPEEDRILLESYPTCTVAVAYTELMICRCEPGETSSWDIMMAAQPPMSPEEIIKMIRDVLESEVQEGDMCRASEALAQTYDPNYFNFIAGKLGMM